MLDGRPCSRSPCILDVSLSAPRTLIWSCCAVATCILSAIRRHLSSRMLPIQTSTFPLSPDTHRPVCLVPCSHVVRATTTPSPT
ncbi:hypothetical protein BDV98DRAFT_66506 [Pterulicium gracile]|uniref:Uncharacterized protein n=1 Tax=Pterulicium gracile TaxID=1884261 RepID=A0A5C3QK28_9AGAR|nr:hypothetical protein BDV98DRAFT_66506 [Pterula gracilis]